MGEQTSSAHWLRKFGNAVRGVKRGVRGESSFFVHFFVGVCVVTAAAILRMPISSWCVLALCIASVMVAEMFNTALEHLAKAITSDEHSEIRDALDIASGAVLLASIGAASVGALLFVTRLAEVFG